MRNTLQRHWFTMVRRSRTDGLLDAQTVYRGTDGECAALLLVEPGTLKVVAATWESYAPEVKTVEVKGLVGVEAYFKCGPVLKETLTGLGKFTRSLFAETVRGIIQAETFLLAERGFASPSAYSHYWEKFYAGSCRYYSNLERISNKWDEYAGTDRLTSLFNRFKSQNVYIDEKHGYRVAGMLSDSFHELSVDLALDPDLLVTKANGVMLRVPDNVCCEAVAYINELPGRRLDGLRKKQVADLLGAGEGCVHLIDLVHDAVESVKIEQLKGDGKN
ncbi:MAG TPA: DUF2889 domain-containing protein [Desulfotomaculum sp.]|nr:MAG: hypothetical protein JL56_16820 [Desulfotomaculum sp. BICA1-6]HBX23579.1 DUF2889 domain-containing protein [Desulfotomaculum sp.]